MRDCRCDKRNRAASQGRRARHPGVAHETTAESTTASVGRVSDPALFHNLAKATAAGPRPAPRKPAHRTRLAAARTHRFSTAVRTLQRRIRDHLCERTSAFPQPRESNKGSVTRPTKGGAGGCGVDANATAGRDQVHQSRGASREMAALPSNRNGVSQQQDCTRRSADECLPADARRRWLDIGPHRSLTGTDVHFSI